MPTCGLQCDCRIIGIIAIALEGGCELPSSSADWPRLLRRPLALLLKTQTAPAGLELLDWHGHAALASVVPYFTVDPRCPERAGCALLRRNHPGTLPGIEGAILGPRCAANPRPVVASGLARFIPPRP